MSQELARRGARVVLACRSRERGQRALAEIQAATKDASLLLGEVDLSSMASIRSFARWLLQECPEIHLLVNNAAVCGMCPDVLPPNTFQEAPSKTGIPRASPVCPAETLLTLTQP